MAIMTLGTKAFQWLYLKALIGNFCMTMNDSWGYQHNDHNYKTPYQLIWTFVDCISKGGNLLLGVGPKGRWHTSSRKKSIFSTLLPDGRPGIKKPFTEHERHTRRSLCGANGIEQKQPDPLSLHGPFSHCTYLYQRTRIRK